MKTKERKRARRTRSLGLLCSAEKGGSRHLATGRSAAPAFRAATCTGARWPFPPPPQPRHGARRVPAHAPQTEEPRPPPSDQRTHRRHSSFPAPQHAAHRGAGDGEERRCWPWPPRPACPDPPRSPRSPPPSLIGSVWSACWWACLVELSGEE
jgi:hypothetical protein